MGLWKMIFHLFSGAKTRKHIRPSVNAISYNQEQVHYFSGLKNFLMLRYAHKLINNFQRIGLITPVLIVRPD